ncbi:MAG: peptidylprolyl isomerase [Cyclobacteriaceae bacterium]
MKIILSTIICCALFLVGCKKDQSNEYIISTELGDIEIEVYPDKAPISVNNFKKYVALEAFERADFFRVVRLDNQPNNDVKIEVIQGNMTDSTNILPTIPHETNDKSGILHKDGTVSMARLDPGTASLSFFICINDQPELDFGGKRNADGTGFAAFGQVTKGMDVVRKIQSGKTKSTPGSPDLWLSQMLEKKIKINRIYKAD